MSWLKSRRHARQRYERTRRSLLWSTSMFKMRLDSTVAQNAAKAVMELVKSDEQSDALPPRDRQKRE